MFDRFKLFEPYGAAPITSEASIKQWVDRGFLDIRPFGATPTDKEKLVHDFHLWKSWGNAQDPRDLTHIKYLRDNLAPSGPIVPELVSTIKGPGEKTKSQDPLFAYHLFLLLAHDFDQQSLELEAQLARVKTQRESLRSFLQSDALDEGRPPKQPDPFVDVPQDLGELMTENRLLSWGRLFCHEDTQTQVLVTDSPEVFQHFLESVDNKESLLNLRSMPCREGSDVSRWQDPLRHLFSTLLTTPWDATSKKEAGVLIEQIRAISTGKDSEAKGLPDSEPWVFSSQWYLVPDTPVRHLFGDSHASLVIENRRDAQKNALVGLVDPRGLS
jgi:hypothetical protein